MHWPMYVKADKSKKRLWPRRALWVEMEKISSTEEEREVWASRNGGERERERERESEQHRSFNGICSVKNVDVGEEKKMVVCASDGLGWKLANCDRFEI